MRGLASLLPLFSIAIFGHAAVAPEPPQKPVVVIGGGLAGLTAALRLRHRGVPVLLLERTRRLGGRVGTKVVGTTAFTRGPSFYWMSDQIDRAFRRVGLRRGDYYKLRRLDPAYSVVMRRSADQLAIRVDVPGTIAGLASFVTETDPRNTLVKFMRSARTRYEVGMRYFAWREVTSWRTLAVSCAAVVAYAPSLWSAPVNLFGSLDEEIGRHTNDSVAKTVMGWPVEFVGESPETAVGLYASVTYAGHALGTWMPRVGTGRLRSLNDTAPASLVAEALSLAASERGVEMSTSANVTEIRFDAQYERAVAVCWRDSFTESDDAPKCRSVAGVVVASGYRESEQRFLPTWMRHWGSAGNARDVRLTPACVLLHVELDDDNGTKRHCFDALEEHTLFMESGDAFYAFKQGAMALTILVPLSVENRNAWEEDSAERPGRRRGEGFAEPYLTRVVALLSSECGSLGAPSSIEAYGPQDFASEWGPYSEAAYGVANTLWQTGPGKPPVRVRRGASNVAFGGEDTHPGPGMAPAMISGILAAEAVIKAVDRHDRDSEPASTWDLGIWVCVTYLRWVCTAFALSGLVFGTWRDTVRCMRLMQRHGKTFFIAACGLPLPQLCNVARLYAFMRVADDIVDDANRHNLQRAAELAAFKRAFRACMDVKPEHDAQSEGGCGTYSHPVLNGAAELCRQYGFTVKTFDRFFVSMELDSAPEVVCHTMHDLMAYVDGSAAIVGELMMHLFVSGGNGGPAPPTESSSNEERAKWRRMHVAARSAGIALQLTNMIRDVGEDLRMGREYIPREHTALHSVNLRDRDCKYYQFAGMMELFMWYTDSFYEQGLEGANELPPPCSHAVRLALTVYRKTHDRIRAAKYDVFSVGAADRMRGTTLQKVCAAAETTGVGRLVWTVVRWASVRLHLTLAIHAVPLALCLWIGPYAEMLSEDMAEEAPFMTYAGVHALFLWPLIVALGLHAAIDNAHHAFRGSHVADWLLATVVVMGIAFAYATPWDRCLVHLSVWSYPRDRPLWGTWYGVPYEEYAFFVVQTAVVALIRLTVVSMPEDLALAEVATPSRRWPYKMHAAALCVASGAYGWKVLSYAAVSEPEYDVGGPCDYFAIISWWALPVLGLQVALGFSTLFGARERWIQAATVGCTSVLMWTVESWALQHGVWEVHEECLSSLRTWGWPHLPLEEACFFVLTSAMCSFGITLAQYVLADTRRRMAWQYWERGGPCSESDCGSDRAASGNLAAWARSRMACYRRLTRCATRALSLL